MPVFNEINGLTTLQNYAVQSRVCARARARAHTYIHILRNVVMYRGKSLILLNTCLTKTSQTHYTLLGR